METLRHYRRISSKNSNATRNGRRTGKSEKKSAERNRSRRKFEKKIAEPKKSTRSEHTQLPINLILDCGFDDLMIDKELKSLSAQVTRCYSDNHKAPLQVHLTISSFGGHLKERFDGVLGGHHRSWKNVRFLEGDFVQAAEQAKEWMKGEHGGKLVGALTKADDSIRTLDGEAEAGEVVYLTSDSPDTLTELRPYSTYIIGGLVDRNRHKGICYKRAMDRGVRTAKLPIGLYMQMASRFVLATNHVAEIMLRWLELGDWGKAFLAVVPKRKGGVLKANTENSNDEAGGGAGADKGTELELVEDPNQDVEDVEIGNSKQDESFGSTSDGSMLEAPKSASAVS
ncbi:guanine-1-methyltransferase-domain-containing protein [Usnea florida]